MPGYKIEGKKVIISDDNHKDIYWVELSDLVKQKYFTEIKETRDPLVVQEILKFCFSFFCKKLEEKIQSEKRFSFYLFCHLLHEDLIVNNTSKIFEKKSILASNRKIQFTEAVLDKFCGSFKRMGSCNGKICR